MESGLIYSPLSVQFGVHITKHGSKTKSGRDRCIDSSYEAQLPIRSDHSRSGRKSPKDKILLMSFDGQFNRPKGVSITPRRRVQNTPIPTRLAPPTPSSAPRSHGRFDSVRSKWLRVSAVETDLNTGLEADKQTTKARCVKALRGAGSGCARKLCQLSSQPRRLRRRFSFWLFICAWTTRISKLDMWVTGVTSRQAALFSEMKFPACVLFTLVMIRSGAAQSGECLDASERKARQKWDFG